MENLPYFESIDLQELKEYYVVKIDLNGRKTSIDLNFENKSIDKDSIQKIKTFLESIPKFHLQNKSYINNDFEEGDGETKDYINFYFDELDQDEISNIININDIKTPKEILLLNELKLNRIGLYPDGKYNTDYYAVFDYSIDIDGEPCEQLLVVKTNEKGDLDHIAWES
ncbi:DUF2004 domain-containing protein [Flavobacterium quisquiliarum]|jgi:hypothetical protein|uniref:DUF2004 domain-containing protein n=1 Tax=Flavobacterium quisquiliarum TaxID=1834436 RepID=A0ABV8W8I6_9FLAO|nr:DUF2004 domain-containing protein [Flavobacterium quisquiliarum]MBW1654503.1 DUF2004 domain-containing protein [Flavobacterium quisquiliarum]NWL01064.1 hypothetical protein [Flavobacterium collinsii]